MKHQVSVRIESPAFDADAVRIIEITGTETISRLFEMTLRLAALEPGALDEGKLLTSHVELVFERTDEKTSVMTEERRIGGIISTIRDRFLTESEHREVIATFVPRAWQTTLTKTTDIFMDMTVPEIVQKKLETGAGLVGADVEMRLKQTYPKREFVVQYKESDLDFVSRLTEDLGIHFFFERRDDKDVLVFGDENGAFKPSTPESAPFMRRGESANIFELEATRSVVPRVFKARDYNYRNPAMDLLGEVDLPTLAANGYVDEFGPHAKTADEAKFYASIRAQEANSRHLVFEGSSDLPGLRAGSFVTIDGHPRGELKLVVIEVRHQGRQAVFGAQGDAGYRNTFKAIPEAVTFRPARLTQKPVVHGVVTGIVQAEAATNFGAVDGEGRYRVSFMYDTVTDRGEGKASRPLRMAQPSAGGDRGFHQPLKVGTEVIITCLNGDPDRPIISGAVPNPQTPSPVTSANAEKSMWKTNVSRMAFDDDKPRMKMEVDGDKHVFQMGEPNGPELGLFSSTVSNATSMVTGLSTSVSAGLQAWHDRKTALTGQDVINIAGIPSGWSAIKTIDAAVSAVIGVTKAVTAIPAAFNQMFTDFHKDKKKEADEELEEAKKQLKIDPKPRVVTDPVTGVQTLETAEEALDRELTVLEAKDPLGIVTAEARAAARKGKTAEAEAKAWEEGSDLVQDMATVNNAMKAAEAVQSTIQTVAKLFSALANLQAKVADKAEYVAMRTSQEMAAGVARISGERSAADVGSFGKSFNIQGATDSVGIQGMKNVHIVGANHASLFSAVSAAVIGRKRVDVKSQTDVEVAAKNVMLTAKALVDVHSSKDVKIVAHTGAKDIAMPGSTTMLLHSRESIHIESTDKDLTVKMKKNIKMETVEESFELKAKKDIKLEAETEGYALKAKKAITAEAAEGELKMEAKQKKVTVRAHDADMLLLAKKDVITKSSDGNFSLMADKGKGNVQSSKDLKLTSKSGNVKVNGSKINLG